jgi:hypothetical protein
MTAEDQLRKNSDRESQGARRQEELIGGKPPVIKWPSLLTLTPPIVLSAVRAGSAGSPISNIKTESQSQSYFATAALPTISSSWRRALWDSRSEIFPCDNITYVSTITASAQRD